MKLEIDPAAVDTVLEKFTPMIQAYSQLILTKVEIIHAELGIQKEFLATIKPFFEKADKFLELGLQSETARFLRKQKKEDMMDNLRDEIKEELREEFRAELTKELRDEVMEDLREEAKDEYLRSKMEKKKKHCK